MYVCICNAIKSSDIARDPSLITSCGTNCGKCIPYIQQNLIPGTREPIYTEDELVELYNKSLDSETPLLQAKKPWNGAQRQKKLVEHLQKFSHYERSLGAHTRLTLHTKDPAASDL